MLENFKALKKHILKFLKILQIFTLFLLFLKPYL